MFLVEFTKLAAAEEYRKSAQIKKQKQAVVS